MLRNHERQRLTWKIYRTTSRLLQHRNSNDKEVLLQDVSLHSSGRYKCEVSAEAPSFNSVSAEASMEVAGERTSLRQPSLLL